LEIQVADEGDYPERSLYYWAREYSSALQEGEGYSALPRTIVISIVAFKLFPCAEFHSEFQPLEVTRHVPLTDRQVLHYFELPKIPKVVDADDGLNLWLTLFNAETEEDLAKLEALEVSVMNEAIGAYRHMSATDEFKEIERLRSRARHNEASALGNAERRGRAEGERIGEQRADAKWQAVVADKDALIAELQARLDAAGD
jgi:predicted transposase/invertase (TIGR01784 family)